MRNRITNTTFVLFYKDLFFHTLTPRWSALPFPPCVGKYTTIFLSGIEIKALHNPA